MEYITIAHQGSWFHIRVQITFIKMERTGMPLWLLWFMQCLQCLNGVILTVPYFTFSSFSNAVCIECLYGHFVLCDMYWFYGFLHWRLIAYFIDVISSLLTTAMFGFCETEFLCILCVCFKCFSSHLSPVSYHPSPSSSRLIATQNKSHLISSHLISSHLILYLMGVNVLTRT